MTRPSRAIIFVESADFEPDAARCMQYLEDRGYQFEGIIQDDQKEAERMLKDNEATVAIVVSADQLKPPISKPRIEVVPPETPRNDPPAAGRGARHRRPHRL